MISVDSAQSYQTMQGFGASLNDSSAYELTRGVTGVGTAAGLSALEAEPALRDLFSPQSGIGLSYVRVSIGGNDFAQADYSHSPSLANEYSENDPAPGSTATAFSAAQLRSFISHDLEYQVPVLQAALARNPALKIMAAPWTAPVWMKCENTDAETGAACQNFDPGGLQAALSGDPGYAGRTLDPADVSQYADYLLEFILAYRAEGLPVSAVSLGNEPANGTWSYPSMTMTPASEVAVAADLTADMRAPGSARRSSPWTTTGTPPTRRARPRAAAPPATPTSCRTPRPPAPSARWASTATAATPPPRTSSPPPSSRPNARRWGTTAPVSTAWTPAMRARRRRTSPWICSETPTIW